MKVVQINTVCGIGSTGRIAVDLSHIIKAEGSTCEIVYGHYDSSHPFSHKMGSKLNGLWHKLASRLLDRQGFFSRRATKRLVMHLRELNPDIVHLHNLHGHYINIDILFRYLSQARVPTIWTLHDCWPFTGHCAYFDYAGCEKWRTGCGRCPNLRSYPPSWFADRSASNYKRKKEIFNRLSDLVIVTPSRWLADLVKESFLASHDVRVIPNGIDTAIFKPVHSDVRSRLALGDKIVLLGVAMGGFTGRKGFVYFLDLARQLPADYVIVLVGLTDAEKASLPDNMIGITRTDSMHELAEIYSAADIFVNPTLEDNFPTTNLEALACGTPVLTFDTGGSPEAIDSQTGRCVPKGDSEALLQAVLEMNKSFKQEHTDSCRLRATAMYDKNVAFSAYRDLYKIKFDDRR